MHSPPTIAQPTFIGGKYRLFRPLGSGAWGTVYEAEHGWTHQRVALKLLRPEHSSNREVALRFIAEARAASRVSHPSVVRVLDVGEDADTGALYIVQDLLEGFDLGRMLERETRLAPHDALDILLPAMGALVALHRAGVVHRDLKPSNLFLARDPERGLVPTVIDFGVARLIDGSGSIRTLTGELLGTPEYMAPEQVRGETDVDHRADVWAIGVMLFECIVGHTPFLGPDVPATLLNVLNSAAPRLDAVAPGVPEEIAEIVAQALAPNRDDRIPSMRAFLQALLECPRIEEGFTGRDFLQRHKLSFPDLESIGDEPTQLDALAAQRASIAHADTVWLLTRYAETGPTTPRGAAPSDASPTPLAPTPPTRPSEPASNTRSSLAYSLTEIGPPSRPRNRRWLIALPLIALLALVAGAALWPRGDGTYTVRFEVAPRVATVRFDGRAAGVGSLHQTLRRDGVTHHVDLAAVGFRPMTVYFRDRAPPSRITLIRE